MVKVTKYIIAIRSDMPTLRVLRSDMRPDESGWTNRIAVLSGSTTATYIVGQHAQKRHWGCSCRGWTNNRKCKHLTRLGLPNHERPFEIDVVIVAPITTVSPKPLAATTGTLAYNTDDLTSLGRRRFT